MHEERTKLWIRQREHIRGHLWNWCEYAKGNIFVVIWQTHVNTTNGTYPWSFVRLMWIRQREHIRGHLSDWCEYDKGNISVVICQTDVNTTKGTYPWSFVRLMWIRQREHIRGHCETDVNTTKGTYPWSFVRLMWIRQRGHIRGHLSDWCEYDKGNISVVICQTDVNTTKGTYLWSFVRLILFFPHSWLITRFVTRVARRLPPRKQELPTLLCTWFKVQHFVGLVLLLNLQFSYYYLGRFKLLLFVFFSFFWSLLLVLRFVAPRYLCIILWKRKLNTIELRYLSLD
jgi:hypothetical protein